MLDKAFAEEMVEIVRGHVERATAPLRDEIAALRRALDERPAPERGERGEPGAPGERGQDGRDGIDGAPGERGADGRDGQDGRDGEPVSAEAIAEAVRQYLAANPPPAGADGRDGQDGAPGEKGLDGRDGADGVGLAGALIDRDGQLVVTLTNGEARSLGPVLGRDGADGAPGQRGADGRDGFSLDDFDTELLEDGRTLRLKFVSGDVTETHDLALPLMIYRGVHRDGEAYDRGDTTTWAGSLWHCDEPTTDKPGEGSKAWTLAAKRGRDGKDAVRP